MHRGKSELLNLFFNRVGLCQLSAYAGELDFGGAVGKKQVLLGGNMGYGFHTLLRMGPKVARVFR